MTEEEPFAEFEFMQNDGYVDPDEEVKYPPVALSAGVFYDPDGEEYPLPIATYGNFVFVQAPPKARKTFFVSLIAAAYLGGKKEYTGLLKGHRGNKKLLHIDTEQGKWHCSRVFKRVLKMSTATKEDYYTYGLREYGHRDCVLFLKEFLKYNKNIGMVIIDGIADLIGDVNDINQSTELVQEIMTLSSKYKCAIITVIHSNYGSEKPTGHLGSFLEKKTECQIQLEKNTQNDGWTTVKCRRTRNTPFSNMSFRINKEHYPEIIEDLYDPLA